MTGTFHLKTHLLLRHLFLHKNFHSQPIGVRFWELGEVWCLYLCHICIASITDTQILDIIKTKNEDTVFNISSLAERVGGGDAYFRW